MRRTMAIVFAGLVVASASTTTASAGSRPAESPFLIALDRKTGKQVWRATNPEHGTWSVLGEQQGLVFVTYASCDGTRRAATIAFDASTGDERWRLERDPAHERITRFAVGREGVVVAKAIAPDDGSVDLLQGIATETGHVLWEKPIRGREVIGASGDLVLLRSDRPEVVALNGATGRKAWRYTPSSAGSTVLPGVITRTTAILNFIDFRTGLARQVALDMSTGEELWSVLRDDVVYGELGGSGVVFAPRISGGPFIAYDMRTQRELWTAPEPPQRALPPGSSQLTDVPRVGAGLLLLTVSGRVHAINLQTGQVAWEHDLALNEYTPIVAAGRDLVVTALQVDDLQGGQVDGRGVVTAIDAKTGQIRWTAAPPRAGGKNWFIGKHVYGAFGGCGSPDATKRPLAEALQSKKARRRPTLPGGLPPSTIGAGGLHCRVRNGNGCFPTAVATGTIVKRPRALKSEHEHKARRSQALGRLVPVGYTRHRAYTSGLSTWSSTRGLTRLTRWEISSRGRLRA